MPQLKPTRGICLNRSHPLSRDLVGLWLFNEGSGGQVFDLSGNGNNGTFGNQTSWGIGKYGSAPQFDGTDDYILTDYSPVLDRGGTNPFTISIWFYRAVDKGATVEAIMIKGYEGDPEAVNYELYIASDDQLHGFWEETGGANIDIDSGYTINLNQWYQGVLTWDGTNQRIYVDGVLRNSATPNAPSTNTRGIVFGYSLTGTSPAAWPFGGLIDLPMIWNRALTASEIALLYREPFCGFKRPSIVELAAFVAPSGIPILRRRIEAA